MDETTPSQNRENGRDANGRFLKGWAGGPGNPHAKRVHAFRSRLLDSVSERDVEEVVQALIHSAKAGEPWAVKELLDRLIGRAVQAVEVTPKVPIDARPLEERAWAVLEALRHGQVPDAADVPRIEYNVAAESDPLESHE